MEFEEFLNNVEDLPSKVRQNLKTMKMLSIKIQGTNAIVNTKSTTLMNRLDSKDKTLTEQKKKEAIANITELYSRIRQYSDEKEQVASKTYELVDKYIRQLDDGMEKSGLKIGQKKKLSDILKAIKSNKKKDSVGEGEGDDDDDDDDDDSDEMPVDPDEPTFCICDNVSYGDMVACDNPSCPIDWFHFKCVGLTAVPKGEWFCSQCKNKD